ncbi:MAG: phosphoribosylglycinamide synthetase C domain-containing protein [Desulfobulbia bacterium]
MKILCISRDFPGASLCVRLLREGNEVRAFVADPLYGQILDGLIEKVESLDLGLAWVGKDGLIVVDDVGFGELQDRLRGEGYAVAGGSAGGDLLENDRLHCQRVLAEHGVRPVPIHYFENRRDAIGFLRHNPGRWVLKQNGGADKTFCYVGALPDGRDVLDLLEYHGRSTDDDTGHFILQQHIDGVEIGVGRYFNGHDWLGPVELNLEHKNLFPGCLGPKTDEMGTLMWYDPDENNRLFREVLAPLAPHLRQIGFRGDFDINCIVNEQGAFPLEATSRFGYPAFQLQTEFHCSPWAEFLTAVARGESYNLDWHPGYGVVVLVALTPFPFLQTTERPRPLPLGLRIRFHDQPDEAELMHFHPEEITMQRDQQGQEAWHTCSDSGYILHVSGMGATVEEAREMAYQRIDNLVIPKMFYRHDIGLRFLKQDKARLTQWGWI